MTQHAIQTKILAVFSLYALSSIAAAEPWQAASGGMALRGNPWNLAGWQMDGARFWFRLVEHRYLKDDNKVVCPAAETSREDVCAGLGFMVNAPLKEQPRLFARDGTIYPHRWWWGFVWRVPADLGEITMPDGDMALLDQECDWTGNRMTFEGKSGALEITASPLSPALLFNLSAAGVNFFGGPKQAHYLRNGNLSDTDMSVRGPTRWAAGDTDGVLTGSAGDAIPTDKLQHGWLLVWFGKDSPYVHMQYKQSWGYLLGSKFDTLKELVPIYQSDVPVLFVFEDAPGNAELDEMEGLTIQGWADMGEDMKFVAMPLFGQTYPQAAETEKWQAKFPEHVRNLCDTWTQRLSAFPVAASETYGYGPDGATVTEKFEYIELRPDAKRFAPLPPMLALARRKGLAIKTSEEPVDTGFQTYCGPLEIIEGSDEYSWSLPGLERSALDRRQTGGGAVPEWITKSMVEDVRKIIAAGELAPWRFSLGGNQSFRCSVYWTNQAETFYMLSELLPYLPQDAADDLKKYMSALPLRDNAWQPIHEGARREPHDPPYEEDSCTYKRWMSKIGRMTRVPLWSVYGWEKRRETLGIKPSAEDLATAKQAFEAEIEGSEWATLSWFPGANKWPDAIYGAAFGSDDGVGSPRLPWIKTGAHNNMTPDYCHIPIRAVNRHFAGLCSLIRMARVIGDKETEARAWGRLARTAALRYAMAFYTEYLYDAGLCVVPSDPLFAIKTRQFTGNSRAPIQLRQYTPQDDTRQVRLIDHYGIDLMTNDRGAWDSIYIPFLDLTPELGRFMNLTMRDKCAHFAKYMSEQVQPLWHIAHGQSELGSENAESHPTDSYQFFMLHAWVLNTPPDELAWLADTHWIPFGDLFYLHKLAACAAAYRGDEWKGE